MHDLGFGESVPPGVEYEKTVPIGRMSMVPDVAVPFVWSFITAILVGIASLVVVFVSQGSRFPLSPWAAVAVFIIVLILSWFIRSDLATKLLYVTERIVGQVRNGRAGEEKTIHWEITERRPGGGSMWFGDWPEGITEGDMKEWAKAVAVKGESLTGPAWWGRGKPFTQPAYTSFMVQMESLGLVVNHGGSTGRQLTVAGRKMLKDWLK
jgi:hypothetical protein